MARKPLQLYVFVVVLVRRGFRYLLVQEAKAAERGRWYLPAGAVKPGEDLVTAAIRETMEESGVDIEVTGLVAIEHMPVLPGWEFARWRFVLEGRIKPDSPEPRTTPTGDTLGARFYMPSEIPLLNLRGDDAAKLIQRHSEGAYVAPIDLYQLGYS